MNYGNVRSRIAKTAQCSPGNVVVKAGEITPSVDMSNRMVYGWATREIKDQENEVVVADGLDLTTYFPAKVKSVYFNHDVEEEPVGTARRCYRKGDGLYLATHILPTAFGNDLLIMVQHGAVGHYSIGGVVLDASPPNPDEMSKFGIDTELMLRRVMLREVSLVAMPCLPDAALEGIAPDYDKSYAKIDELLTKGLIRRKSAILAGLLDADRTIYSTGIEFGNDDDCGIRFG